MDRKEASDKLGHYVDKYGQLAKNATPETALVIAAGRRALFNMRGGGAANLYLLSEAVHFESIAECLKVIQQSEAA